MVYFSHDDSYFQSCMKTNKIRSQNVKVETYDVCDVCDVYVRICNWYS